MPSPDLFEYAVRLGDDALVLGHRLSEWCSRAPALEEDLALANIALDCLGQASLLLSQACEYEGKGRSADDLAFWREAVEFRNFQIIEIPTVGDFGRLVVRQFLIDSFRLPFFQALAACKEAPLAAIAAKAEKEITYHLRHSRGWILRLGDGTAESRDRVARALQDLWPYTSELFFEDELESRLAASSGLPRRSELRPAWERAVRATLQEATLDFPATPSRIHGGGGRAGLHTEHLGHLLAEMQIVARSHPGAKW